MHVSADAKPRRDPCGCQDLRSRLGTYLRKAVANWQRDIRMALIGADDSLSIAHALLGTSSKQQDRLERYTAFARSAMQRRLQPVDFGVLVQAYKRGTASGFAEAGILPHNAPANGGFYAKQAENDLHGIGEEVIKRFSRTVALGLATGFSGSRLYRNVLPAFRQVALPRVKLLATTLITTAYNGGKLDTFELLGKTHVGIVSETVPKTLTKDANFYKKGSRNVIVEYLTAGDDLVCPICEDLEGTYYTLAGARGLLPRHPNCRCSVELASGFNDAGFDPDEPRDREGQWTAGAAGGKELRVTAYDKQQAADIAKALDALPKEHKEFLTVSGLAIEGSQFPKMEGQFVGGFDTEKNSITIGAEYKIPEVIGGVETGKFLRVTPQNMTHVALHEIGHAFDWNYGGGTFAASKSLAAMMKAEAKGVDRKELWPGSAKYYLGQSHETFAELYAVAFAPKNMSVDFFGGLSKPQAEKIFPKSLAALRALKVPRR